MCIMYQLVVSYVPVSCVLSPFVIIACPLSIHQSIIFFKQDLLISTNFTGMIGTTIRVSTSLDPDQVRCSVGPDLGPNCLQRLSADD